MLLRLAPEAIIIFNTLDDPSPTMTLPQCMCSYDEENKGETGIKGNCFEIQMKKNTMALSFAVKKITRAQTDKTSLHQRQLFLK